MNPLKAAELRALTDRPSQRLARINFTIFAIVTAGFGWLYVAMDRATGAPNGTGSATSGGGTLGQGLWILVPAVTGLILYFVSRDGAGPLGLTLRFPHRARWFGFAGAVSIVATAAMVLAGIAAGAVAFRVAPAPGKPAYLTAVLGGLVFILVKNVFEEFIFRGYGTRTALALGLGGIRPHLLVGAVWALWHIPLFTVWMSDADYQATTSLPRPVFIPMFCLGALVLAVLLGELRIQSGSIWPGVALHTIGGALAAPLLINGHLRFDGHTDALFAPNANSIASMIAYGLAALLLLRVRARNQAKRALEGVEPASPALERPSAAIDA